MAKVKRMATLRTDFDSDEHNALLSALVECGMDAAIQRQAEPEMNSMYVWLQDVPKTTMVTELVEMLHALGFEITRR